jgi:glycine betaine catabolism A
VPASRRIARRRRARTNDRVPLPYHGWTYGLDGRCTNESAELASATVAEWNGFVFVALDPNESLAAFMGEIPPWLAEPRLLAHGRRSTYVAHANWKLLVENFQESHHFPFVHALLEERTPTSAAETWTGSGRWLGGTMAIVEGETVSVDGRLHDRPLIGEAGRVLDAMLFPSLLTSLQPDYFLTYRLVPASASETEITADVFFHPSTARPGFDAPDVYAFWDRVNAEDRAICESQQRNVRSRAFAPRYLPNEEGLAAFERLIAAEL